MVSIRYILKVSFRFIEFTIILFCYILISIYTTVIHIFIRPNDQTELPSQAKIESDSYGNLPSNEISTINWENQNNEKLRRVTDMKPSQFRTSVSHAKKKVPKRGILGNRKRR